MKQRSYSIKYTLYIHFPVRIQERNLNYDSSQSTHVHLNNVTSLYKSQIDTLNKWDIYVNFKNTTFELTIRQVLKEIWFFFFFLFYVQLVPEIKTNYFYKQDPCVLQNVHPTVSLLGFPVGSVHTRLTVGTPSTVRTGTLRPPFIIEKPSTVVLTLEVG